MIKSILTLVAVSSLLAAPAFAKKMPLPDEDSAISTIDIPEKWEPEEIDNGVEGQSPDSAIYIAVVAVESDKGMQAEIDDTFAMLKDKKVELDESTKSEDKFKLNGIEADEITYAGKDEDGPASVCIAFVPIKDKVIVVTYWVSTKDEKKHQEEVGKILHSLKVAE
jgi:hypothetical protein